jgi:hypothetical protein
MTYGFIYKIEFPNGKHYIGLTTTSLKQRKQEHKLAAKRGAKQYLYNALRKYEMVEIFELIEIDTANTYDELCEKEIQYIQVYNSYYEGGCGYNMTLGGNCVANGYVFTEVVRQKMSERMKLYHQENPEARQKLGEYAKTYYENNPEAKQKTSEAMKKYYKDNTEARQQVSESLKKYYEVNADAKQKNSEAQKKYYKNNPDIRQKNSEKRKQYHKDNPEFIKKMLDIKGKNKPFDVFTIDGTFIKTFTYQIDANEYLQKEHNITSKINICQVLTGSQKSSKGFVFKYK